MTLHHGNEQPVAGRAVVVSLDTQKDKASASVKQLMPQLSSAMAKSDSEAAEDSKRGRRSSQRRPLIRGSGAMPRSSEALKHSSNVGSRWRSYAQLIIHKWCRSVGFDGAEARVV